MGLMTEPVAALRLSAVADYIVAYPESYDQDTICGTPCCIAGHLVALFGTQEQKLVQHHPQPNMTNEAANVITNARKLIFGDIFGIPTGHNLFGAPENWPKAYADLYLNAETPQERARVGASRIRYFLEKGV